MRPIRCLIRFVQMHESFRKPELEALAQLALSGTSSSSSSSASATGLKIIEYSDDSPFGIIELPCEQTARALIARSILSYDIYELWGSGDDYGQLEHNIRQNAAIQWQLHQQQSFRFAIDSFQGKKSRDEQRQLIESFRWFDFQGDIRMRDPELKMCIFEDYELDLLRRRPSSPAKGPAKAPSNAQKPRRVHLGRWIAASARDAITTYNLKKRSYISRTSMDAELALVTANMALAAPGRIIYDPVVGTGSLTVACAHFGASVLGSDIDGRSIRGTQRTKDDPNLFSNFQQYAIEDKFVDSFIADLTHTPLRVNSRFLDAVVCDPPYGIREGPKVLGFREGKRAANALIDGIPAYLREGFIAPKRPYGFDDMLEDILIFSYDTLVDNGRLSMWMPTANDDDIELAIPRHPGLELISVSVQQFTKWARRLLTYSRLPGHIQNDTTRRTRELTGRVQANELNSFRKKYFEGFRNQSDANS